MFAMNKWPCATAPPLLLGTILEPLGITVLASALNSGNLHLIFGMLALTGVGTGIRLMPGTLHGIGYFPSQISHVVSLMALANTLGGTLATTIMLNIFNSTLQNHGIDFSSSSSESISAIQELAPEQVAFAGALPPWRRLASVARWGRRLCGWGGRRCGSRPYARGADRTHQSRPDGRLSTAQDWSEGAGTL